MVDGISGVQIGPGATLFARIPFSARSWASEAVKFAIPAFVIAYGARFGLGLSELTDDELMIDAPGCMCGMASLQRVNMAVRLVATVWSHSSSETSSSESWLIWKAALLTRTSTRPNSSTALGMIVLQYARSEMSPGISTHLRPACS